MAQFDPALRRETWIFQRLRDGTGVVTHRRMRFNLVQYDGSPDRYIEPVSPSDFFDPIAVQPTILTDADRGRVVDFEFFDARPYEVHAFDDPVGL